MDPARLTSTASTAITSRRRLNIGQFPVSTIRLRLAQGLHPTADSVAVRPDTHRDPHTLFSIRWTVLQIYLQP